MSDTPSQWEIVPQSIFSRHFDLLRGGEKIVSLHMAMWTEGCEFTIAGHDFAIRRASILKDGFQLLNGDLCVCDGARGLWALLSRRFDLTAGDQKWTLRPAGWFTLYFRLFSGEREIGTVRPAGWFTLRRVADFSDEVPLPVQVFAIFLVLILSRRQRNSGS